MYRGMWEAAMDDMMARLLNVSVSGLQYVGMIQQNAVYMPRLEHLTCYLPGNLALGVAYGAVAGAKAEHYMSLAQNLTYSCWQMYDKMPIGELSPYACRCKLFCLTGGACRPCALPKPVLERVPLSD